MRLRNSRVALVLLLAVFVAGCADYPRIHCEPRATPALGELHADAYALIRVYYATDRNQTKSELLTELFGNDRSDSLKLGSGQVSIPPGHCRGRLEAPLVGSPHEPTRHVALVDVSAPQEHSEFFQSLRASVAQSRRREVFVFVHGFAMTFENAARRTAQIAHDIRFDGPAVLYSWPSRGWLLSYLVDTTNAEWSAYYLAQFLDELVNESGAEHIHLMAHSMGTRVLTRAVKDYLARRAGASSPVAGDGGDGAVFDQIILAAADMDAQIFERDYARHMATAARRVTIYVSSADWALGGTQRLHLYSRLGQGSLRQVDLDLLTSRIDVINATSQDRGPVGHVYYSRSPRVLDDLRGVLAGETPAERGLRREFFYGFAD